jgi:hypothetical protein
MSDVNVAMDYCRQIIADQKANDDQALVNRGTIEYIHQALEEYARIKPKWDEMKANKEQIFDKATYRHGDSLDDYYFSEVLLISFGEICANLLRDEGND